jgi:hypothetical protein
MSRYQTRKNKSTTCKKGKRRKNKSGNRDFLRFFFRGMRVFEVKTRIEGLSWAVWARQARKKCAKMSKK